MSNEKLVFPFPLEVLASMPVDPAFEEVVDRVAEIVHKISGNKYGKKQACMIESRVKKRMIELDIQAPKAYLEFIDKNTTTEISALVSLLTTHHTFFFREFAHFELLITMLPEIVANVKKRGEKVVQIWSAACSRGHEAYSLAMFMEYHLPKIDPTMSYKILGSDIDHASVHIAGNGVYHHNELKEIPMNYLADLWAKGSGEIFLYSKVKKTMRAKCDFKEGNLLKVKEIIGAQKFDIIFCRNVFIYFEPHQVEAISRDLLKALHPNGLFFTGLSESLTSSSLEITALAPSAYVAKVDKNSQTSPQVNSMKTLEAKAAKPADCYRVLCVDDSPSIITFLKKILTKDAGFEVVATASNGLEAYEILKTTTVDILTLDIHMPEMDGVSYLKKYYKHGHVPVVMIASASREDSDVAVQALRYGACDYVEKPTLTNLDDRSDEIRIKLRAAVAVPFTEHKISSMDKSFQHKINIDNPEIKMRLMIATLTDMPKIVKFYLECTQTQPPSVIMFEGYGDAFEAIIKKYQGSFKHKVAIYDEKTQKLEVNTIYFADAKKMMKPLAKDYGKRFTSILCYGLTSKWVARELATWINSYTLVEDFGEKENMKNPMYGRATDFMPATSFAYMSCACFSGGVKKKAC